MNLTSPSQVKKIINEHKFLFSKSLGQNFLIDSNVVDKIVNASGIDKNCGVIEVGPGIGTLTRHLCEHAADVLAVEIDKNLIPILSETLAEYNNVEVINNDILKVNVNEIIEKKFQNMPVHIVANLPYYITTPIIMGILENRAKIDSITVMIQKEVADRIVAPAGGKDYGALSVAAQYYTQPSIVCTVPPHCFMPQPKVSSSVVHMKVLKNPAVEVSDEVLFFKVVKAAFGQRRKTLLNALHNSGIFGKTKEELVQIITKLGLDINIRGERLTLESFRDLCNHLMS